MVRSGPVRRAGRGCDAGSRYGLGSSTLPSDTAFETKKAILSDGLRELLTRLELNIL